MAAIFYVFIFLFCLLNAEDSVSSLFSDLEKVEDLDKGIQKELPFSFNYLMQGGYFVMPSARAAKDGTIAFGFSYLPPYRIYSLSCQLFERIEMSGNYLVFHGLLDGIFGNEGFGDQADRQGNVKFIILKKSDGVGIFPELAVGINDFIGSQRFRSVYVVATKSFVNQGLELSLGWGDGRMKGLFGAFAWTPFHKWNKFLNELSLSLEYDANNYRHNKHEHPGGREVKCPINGGLKWNLFDVLSLTASSIRGKEAAFAANLHYNFGETKGLLKKVSDPLPYKQPVDNEPIIGGREKDEFIQDLAYALKEQGLPLFTAILKGSVLWLKVTNIFYRNEDVVKDRLESVLLSLAPSDIYAFEVVIESEGLPCHEYYFLQKELALKKRGKISSYEMDVLSPLKEASSKPNIYEGERLYERNKRLWILTLRPDIRNYFGRTKGKYKYDAGFLLGIEGYVLDELYYNLSGCYTIASSSAGMGDRDVLNPSRILNVRTDSIRYYHASSAHLNTAYLQKNFNLSHGCFLKLSGGYFEIAYGGAAGEFLFYPVMSNFAIGAETAFLWKRNYYGIGFADTIRKWHDARAEHVHYDYLVQYFIDFYYDFKPLSINFKFSTGQFLARDKGIRIEMTRYFRSGFEISLWYTFTNGGDRVNGKTYFDKGFKFSFPLDFFLPKSSKSRLGYGMSAWLRDVGAKASTGQELYPIIYYERKR